MCVCVCVCVCVFGIPVNTNTISFDIRSSPITRQQPVITVTRIMYCCHGSLTIVILLLWGVCRTSCWSFPLVSSARPYGDGDGVGHGFRSYRYNAITVVGTRLWSSLDESSTTPTNTEKMKAVRGVRDLVNDYDLFLLDMWGVMHDGSRPYEGVVEVIQKLKRAGKRMIILSNSSKRKHDSIRMLRKLGFQPEEDFERIITSGEVSYQMLGGFRSTTMTTSVVWPPIRNMTDPKRAVVLGSGNDDVEYLHGCGWEIAPPSEASLIVARGTFTIHDGVTVMDKRRDGVAGYDAALSTVLDTCAERRIPMLVTNPDKIRPDAERPPMPGHIGDAYEAALARRHGGMDRASISDLVKRIGKPFPDVYDVSLGGNGIDKGRVCMVGDALETDVTGGTLAGIATVWVLMDGIHAPDVVGKDGTWYDAATEILTAFNGMSHETYARGRILQPDYAMPHFRW